MFDLPVTTPANLKEYREFRKFLLKSGFIMMQESVYTKLALNASVVNSIRDKIYKNKPPKGIVQMLTITEKQFNSIEYVVGNKDTDVLDNPERMIII